MHKETPMRLYADFSTEILQTRESGKIYSSAEGKKNFQPRILYPARLSSELKVR